VIILQRILGRENLVASMMHGRKHLAATTGASAQSNAWIRAAIAVFAAAAIAGGLLFLGRLIA
jgi:hypothetical protein